MDLEELRKSKLKWEYSEDADTTAIDDIYRYLIERDDTELFPKLKQRLDSEKIEREIRDLNNQVEMYKNMCKQKSANITDLEKENVELKLARDSKLPFWSKIHLDSHRFLPDEDVECIFATNDGNLLVGKRDCNMVTISLCKSFHTVKLLNSFTHWAYVPELTKDEE